MYAQKTSLFLKYILPLDDYTHQDFGGIGKESNPAPFYFTKLYS